MFCGDQKLSTPVLYLKRSQVAAKGGEKGKARQTLRQMICA